MKRIAILIAAMGSIANGFAAGTPKNLIAIVTDDQARWTIGCYGGKEIPTPNLDRIAAGGARFDNAFVHTPVCSPSRGTYLTGRLGTELGFTDWLTNPQAQKSGVTPATPTWPAILAKHGYTTGLVGKWHLGSKEDSLPWNNGLTRFTGNLGGGWATNKVQFITEKGDKVEPPGYSVEICTDLAMKFMDEHKDKPFALLVHYREPHAAYVPMPEEDMAASGKADLRVPDYPGLKQPYTSNARRDYYASIAALDRNIGRLLDYLTKAGLDDKTIVTFTSDHGYNIGEHGIQHKGNGIWITEDNFRKTRPNMFDTSIRVPLLIRHPGGKPGTVVGEWVSNADMFATSLGLLGVEKPQSMPANSRDLSAAVHGGNLAAEKFPHELFGQYDLVNSGGGRHMRMIRTDRWKLNLHLNEPAQHELYDLAADPGERTNLFGKPGMEEAVRDLRQRLCRHMAAIKDPRLGEVESL
jgi:arylsulfatase A-like enzyme